MNLTFKATLVRKWLREQYGSNWFGKAPRKDLWLLDTLMLLEHLATTKELLEAEKRLLEKNERLIALIQENIQLNRKLLERG